MIFFDYSFFWITHTFLEGTKKYNESSLISSLKRKIPPFLLQKWGIGNNVTINLYGVLLADSTKKLQVSRWGDTQYFEDENQKLEKLSSYTYLPPIENITIKNWWHLGAYKNLGKL